MTIMFERTRMKVGALGRLFWGYLSKPAGADDPEIRFEELNRLSGQGHSRGWRFNRDEIHERS